MPSTDISEKRKMAYTKQMTICALSGPTFSFFLNRFDRKIGSIVSVYSDYIVYDILNAKKYV